MSFRVCLSLETCPKILQGKSQINKHAPDSANIWPSLVRIGQHRANVDQVEFGLMLANVDQTWQNVGRIWRPRHDCFSKMLVEYLLSKFGVIVGVSVQKSARQTVGVWACFECFSSPPPPPSMEASFDRAAGFVDLATLSTLATDHKRSG